MRVMLVITTITVTILTGCFLPDEKENPSEGVSSPEDGWPVLPAETAAQSEFGDGWHVLRPGENFRWDRDGIPRDRYGNRLEVWVRDLGRDFSDADLSDATEETP